VGDSWITEEEPLSAPISFFHAVGYLKVPDLVDTDECAQLRDVTDQIVELSVAGNVMRRPDRTRIDQAVSMHPAILTVATSDRLVSVLEPVLGPNIELVENRHNHLSTYRLPATDRLHRDILQWSRSIVTVLVYLSDCTDLAASTRVVPGSHLWPSTGQPNNGGTWLDESATYSSLRDQALPVPTRAGDVILMHGQLYHAGAGASAVGPRIVLTLAYRSADELEEHEPARCRLVSGRRTYRGRGAVRV
jgi:ectoine hydroxylase-related dioxygenase (phytanoyl-CoA dioxygenase family)